MVAADGLPYGRYPRLLLAWVTTAATRTKTPRLDLGPSLSSFMAELGVVPTGGRWGSHSPTAPTNQTAVLVVHLLHPGRPQGGTYQDAGFRVAQRMELWWDAKAPEQAAIFGSHVDLTEEFFRSITDRPVPVDIRALRALRAPLALDIYTWLTYRNSYLQKRVTIPWEALELQFGSDYHRTRDFKAAFLKHLEAVVTVYPDARISEGTKGLILKPSPPHVKRLKAL